MIFRHLNGARPGPNAVSAAMYEGSGDDVVIVSALRTPICKSRRGGLKDTLVDDMLQTVFTGVINDAGEEGWVVQSPNVVMFRN